VEDALEDGMGDATSRIADLEYIVAFAAAQTARAAQASGQGFIYDASQRKPESELPSFADMRGCSLMTQQQSVNCH